MHCRFCLVFIRLFFISTSSIIIIACDFWGLSKIWSQTSTLVFSGIKLVKDGMVIYDITFRNLPWSSKLLSEVTCVSVVFILWHSIRPTAPVLSAVSYSININPFCCLCYDGSIVSSTACSPHLHRKLQLCEEIVFSRLHTNEEKVVKTAYM